MLSIIGGKGPYRARLRDCEQIFKASKRLGK